MRFRTTILQSGKTATGIAVPEGLVLALGGGKRPPVKVTLNGHSYRTTVAPMGGRYLIGVSAEVRAAAKVAGGDAVTVEVELDTAPRTVTVPIELAAALRRHPIAQSNFERLSNSRKQLYTLPIEKARTEATRQKHVDRALAELGEH